MDIDANDLMLFAHVVEAGSFSAATVRAALPKSTISRRIAMLENALGERLLVRNTRRLVMTEFGERILDHARRLITETEAALAVALHRQDTPRGVLRISVLPDLVEIGLAEICHAFAVRYPEVRLELDLSPRHVDLLAERFDIALRGAASLPDDSTLVARRLCDFRLGLYASSDYLAAHGMPASPEELASHACLQLMGGDGAAIPWRLQHGERQWEGIPQGHLATNSPRLLRDLVAQGMGIGELPEHFAAALVGEGRLQRVLPSWQLPVVPLWCITAGRRLLPPGITAFIEMMKDSMRQYTDLHS